MPVIGIDCRFASAYAGLGTYTRELVTALVARHDSLEYVLFVRSADESWLAGLQARIVTAPFAHYSIAEQTKFPSIIRSGKIDLLFSPQFNVPVNCPVPFVCTIHDLILHRFPNQASPSKRLAYHLLFERSLSKARHIICVSQATRADLHRRYPSTSQSKTSVIYPPLSPVFHLASVADIDVIRKKYSISGDYILYVGGAKEHKNVQTLINAFHTLAYPDLSLVLVTGGKEALTLSLGTDVKRLTDVPTEDLPALYSGARMYATATLAEGFGLPVIEAMACGCPVVASDIESLREITQGRATLVLPTIENLASAFQAALTTSVDREALATGWHELYAAKNAAELTAKVLLDVVSSPA